MNQTKAINNQVSLAISTTQPDSEHIKSALSTGKQSNATALPYLKRCTDAQKSLKTADKDK